MSLRAVLGALQAVAGIRAERRKLLTLTIACHEGRPPADDIIACSCCPEPARIPHRGTRIRYQS
jgi:hypothetical protein